MTTPITADPDERVVEEVHCAECGTPIPAIPSWYAKVNVKFACDTCRQKSPKLAATLPTLETESSRSRTIDSDTDAEPAIDDIDVDDIEIEDADAEADLGEE